MFHFPAFPPHALCVQAWVTGHDSCRVSPFGHPRISARLAAPRGLSQPPTSFIGSWCQGIHRAPLLTWPQRCSRPLCSSQGAGGPGLGVPRLPRHCRCGSRPDRSIRDRTSAPATARERRGRRSESLRRSPCRARARSLRTQQRAWAAPAPSPRSHRRAGCTGGVASSDGLLVSVPPVSSAPRANVSSAGLDRTGVVPAGQVLLRKEVIQPHLPVRLPCYDFVPIADPTFDSSPRTRRLGHWLRVLPTFVT